MRKDRNCGVPYPVYPMPGNMMPGMPNQMIVNPNMMANPNMMSNSSNTIEQQLNNLSNQVSNLEKRVTSLESVVGNNTTGYSSNYQMM